MFDPDKLKEGPIPEGCTEIAHGGSFLVYKHKDDDGTIFVKGLDAHFILGLNRQEWDLFSAVIAYADLKIRGVME